MASNSGFYADDGTFYDAFAEFLNPNQYEYHEVDSSEVASNSLLHEMQNIPPPEAVLQDQSTSVADEHMPQKRANAKTSRFKKNTKTDLDNVQSASVKDRTLKQIWGVKVFRGNSIFLQFVTKNRQQH